MTKAIMLAGAASLMTSAAAVAQLRDSENPKDSITREMSFDIRAELVDEESRTVELSFSSEEPYERWWGTEILDHGKSAVELGRLNGSAALLMDHNIRDQVGVVEKAWLKGKKGRALVRFGKSARADEIFNDVKDGIRKLVSVGYRIKKLVLEKEEDGECTYRALEWEPYEISLVSVPADTTVGVGRDGEIKDFDPRTLVNEEEEDMFNGTRDGSGNGPAPVVSPAPAAAPAATAQRDNGDDNRQPAQVVDQDALRSQTLADERQRAANIRAMGARVGATELAEAAIADGRSVDQFVRDFNALAPDSQAIRAAEDPAIGLNGQERNSYSFVRLMNALANPQDRRAQESAAFEIECSNAAQQQRSDGEMRGYTVPVDVLRPSREGSQRDLVVGTSTAGGHTVATDLLAESFIDLLRNNMALQGLGARMLTDLNGNIAIPRQTGGATAYWVAESGAPTESQQAFDQVAMTPKTVGAYTDISRKLLLQSSIDVEAFVRQDLAVTLALAIDLAGINGSGSSNQPRGVLNTSGIGSVVGGTDGAAPDYADIVGLETAVAVDNAAIGSLGYLTNAAVRGKLKLTEKFSGTNGNPVWEDGNNLNGYSAAVSNQVPSNLTKGSASGICSAIMFGNWADLLIGMWGGLDLMVDPFTSSTSGTVRIVALQDVDVAVRHAESFSAMVDALTA
jgi:HK97 family phage major capsid protein/HK97 family phage prohead protease